MIKSILIQLFLMLGKMLAKRTDTMLDDDFMATAEMLAKNHVPENETMVE